MFEVWQNDKLLNQEAHAKDYQEVLEKTILNCFLLVIDQIKPKDQFVLNDIVQLIQSDINCSPKEIWQVLRLSLTGQRHGPSLESIILIYGFKKTAKRIHAITES